MANPLEIFRYLEPEGIYDTLLLSQQFESLLSPQFQIVKPSVEFCTGVCDLAWQLGVDDRRVSYIRKQLSEYNGIWYPESTDAIKIVNYLNSYSDPTQKKGIDLTRLRNAVMQVGAFTQERPDYVHGISALATFGGVYIPGNEMINAGRITPPPSIGSFPPMRSALVAQYNTTLQTTIPRSSNPIAVAMGYNALVKALGGYLDADLGIFPDHSINACRALLQSPSSASSDWVEGLMLGATNFGITFTNTYTGSILS